MAYTRLRDSMTTAWGYSGKSDKLLKTKEGWKGAKRGVGMGDLGAEGGGKDG